MNIIQAVTAKASVVGITMERPNPKAMTPKPMYKQ